MTQPDIGAREIREREEGLASAESAGSVASGQFQPDPRPSPGQGSESDSTAQMPVLPPGQYVPRTLPVLHYGPIPSFHSETWDLRIFGGTESGDDISLRWDDVAALPIAEVTADFHCVTKFTVPALRWAGVPAAEVLRLFPPAASVTHVMVWADFGYSANIRITDFAADNTVLATHCDGAPLTAEHGYPMRLVVPHLYGWKSVKWVRAIEYLTADRRGFWEERGYHNTADPWLEQRYSYQERDGEGPPL